MSKKEKKSNISIPQKENHGGAYFRVIGIILIVIASIIGVNIKCPTSSQIFGIYLIGAIGVALIFPKSAEKSHAKFTIPEFNLKGVLYGEVAWFLIFVVINPIGRLNKEGCPTRTNITVSVHGKGGKQDIILKQGKVGMDVNGKIDKSPIDENGQAFFRNMIIGDSLRLYIDFSEPYKPIHRDSIYVINGNDNLDLPIKLYGIDKVWGKVLYNYEPLSGVKVELEGKTRELNSLTDSLGKFSFSISEEMQQQKYLVIFKKTGFKTDTAISTPQTGQSLKVVLEKQ